MIHSTTVSSVRPIDPRGMMANMTKKTPGSTNPDGKTLSKPHASSGQDIRANEGRNLHGALTNFRHGVREFTFGVLRPKSGLIGEKTYSNSHSMTLENLSKEHIGAAAGIKNTLREYVRAAVEIGGPPVAAFVKPIKILHQQAPKTSAADMPQDIQHINMVV